MKLKLETKPDVIETKPYVKKNRNFEKAFDRSFIDSTTQTGMDSTTQTKKTRNLQRSFDRSSIDSTTQRSNTEIKENRNSQMFLDINFIDLILTQFLDYLKKKPQILVKLDLTQENFISQAFLLQWYVQQGKKLFFNNTQPFVKDAYRSYTDYTRKISIPSLGRTIYLKYLLKLIPNLNFKRHCMGLKLYIQPNTCNVN